MKDLILLVADKNTQFALKGALERPEALGIRPVEFEFRIHSGHDGGIRTTGPEMLTLLHRMFRHGLLVMDYEGCGEEQTNATALEAKLDERLKTGWQNNAKAIVIEPEVDVWVWGSDNAVQQVIEWPAGQGIRDWLRDRGFSFDCNNKPTRPKEAMEEAMRKTRSPRSSALYQQIAERISVRHCKDNAFARLRTQLISWFPKLTTEG